ncbi:MAG TPA: C40 family peptidase [Gemmatimonadales bacterium]|nr:C40 family peptidase [Gemmatimonadales bacterium]
MTTDVIARAPLAPLCAQPSLRAEQVSQLVLGEGAELLESSGDWRRVRAFSDGYEGWVHRGYVSEVERSELAAWQRDAGGWSLGATLRIGNEPVRLPLRARVALDHGAVRLPDGRRGRITDGAIPTADSLLAEARAHAPERWALEQFASAPYLWGGVTPWGVDCSGLVQTSFAARGMSLPRDSSQQIECGAPVSVDQPRPGDLLFFRSETGQNITHVAFAGEADTLVHSTVACGGVLQESWLPGARAGSLRERLVAVRRMEAR